MNPFSWFRRRRKKKKEKQKTIYGEDVKEEKKGSSIGFRENLSQALSFLRPKRKFQFKYLLRLKRILAGGLFAMYSIISVMLIPEVYALLFIATSFILLDYLWKTRSIQWIRED